MTATHPLPVIRPAAHWPSRSPRPAARARHPRPPAPSPCRRPRIREDTLRTSVVWFRTSVEYRATALQAYRLAGLMLDRALPDGTWTAALEQTGEFSSKPPAVILDVDETVLDNSESERAQHPGGTVYSERGGPTGATSERRRRFGRARIHAARGREGVAVFYVTNRDRALEQATRDNLAKYGFPLDAARDTVLTRAERPEWTSSRSPRGRSLVAQDFRILLLVGDDFGDFVAGARGTLAARKSLDDANAAMWGVKWIALPNRSTDRGRPRRAVARLLPGGRHHAAGACLDAVGVARSSSGWRRGSAARTWAACPRPDLNPHPCRAHHTWDEALALGNG